MRNSFRKLSAISLIMTPILFFILSTIAMYLYPGGWALNEDLVFVGTSIYKFKFNFLSDLGMLTTPAGRPNIQSSILFCVSMTLVGIAFILHAISLPSYFSENTKQRKYANFALVAGIISALGFIGVAFSPWDVLPLMHDISVLIGFGISAVYSLFFGLAVLKEKSYPNFYGILSIGYDLLIIAYALVSVFAPSYETFPGRITDVLAQKVVAYIIMLLLPLQAIGTLILLKKNENR